MRTTKEQTMKKIGKILLKILIAILFVVVVIPFLAIYFIVSPICNLIATPIKKSKYKKSSFYKDFKIKYSRDIESSYIYQIYPYVKSNPSIELVKENGTDFYLKGESAIGILCPFMGIYYDNDKIMYSVEEHDEETLSYYNLTYEYEKLAKQYKSIGKPVKLLVYEDHFETERQFALAKNDDLFITFESLEDYKTIKF
jgi:hypothetical protein